MRITHLPTNIVVQCQNDRSQHRNRDEAWKINAEAVEHLADGARKVVAITDPTTTGLPVLTCFVCGTDARLLSGELATSVINLASIVFVPLGAIITLIGLGTWIYDEIKNAGAHALYRKLAFVTLGCPKNTVDSEGMAMLLGGAPLDGPLPSASLSVSHPIWTLVGK